MDALESLHHHGWTFCDVFCGTDSLRALSVSLYFVYVSVWNLCGDGICAEMDADDL